MFDFSAVIESLYDIIVSLIHAIPESIAGSTRPSALLELIYTLTSYPQTAYLVASKKHIVEAVIRSVGYRAVPVISKIVLKILTTLLNFNNGVVIIPHSKVHLLLISIVAH